MTTLPPMPPEPEIVRAVSYEGDDGKLYGYANHIDFERNPGAVPVIFMREADLIALRSYTEDCLARLRVAVGALAGVKGQKDCGCDGPEEAGEQRDAMYRIACYALAAIGPLPPTERSKDTI